MAGFRKGIYLVGSMNSQIRTSKLPSKGDVLSVLFYNMRIVNLNLYSSASLVIDEVDVFWKKARIPTQNRSNCIIKLQGLYNTLRDLEKSKNRKSELQMQRESDFVEGLSDLFDIATSNALNDIKIPEDREFLIMQRQKGRPGCMLGVDVKLTQMEKRKEERITAEEKRKKRYESQNLSLLCKQDSQLSEFNESEAESTEEDNSAAETVKTDKNKKAEGTADSSNSKRARKTIMTPRLAAALDKSRISDRDAVHIVSAAVEALSLDISEYVLNRSSVKRSRENFRAERYALIKSVEIDVPFIELHWDSKLLPHLTENKNVDRLPVIAVSVNFEQLLGVPGITSGEGIEVCSAVFDIAEEWNLVEKIQACCFDTTASNTGKLKGAATLLEQKLGRDTLWLPCRHHIFEVVLAGVFLKTKLIVTSGPEIALFKRFKTEWQTMDKTKYHDFTTDTNIYDSLKNVAAEIIKFVKEKLVEDQPRDDYKELLQLTLIFLGEKMENVNFRSPGPYHLARWMAKSIYCLKIFLFRKQFGYIRKNDLILIGEICVFLVSVYVRAWFSAPNTIDAPLNDINFLKSLVDFKKINEAVANIAILKFLNHLWYLNEECVALSVFDERIGREEKQRMARKLTDQLRGELGAEKQNEEQESLLDSEAEVEESEEQIEKRLTLKLKDVPDFIMRNLPTELLSKNSTKLFTRFDISTDFLYDDPLNWSFREDYQKGKKIVSSLKSVNDTAERGVKLMQEYNDKLTKNEDQKQFLLQVVSHYRKKFPNALKQVLNREF